MKRHHFILIGALIMLLAVCQQKPGNQKSYLQVMEKSSDGTTLLQVNSNSTLIDFTGEIAVTDRGLEFTLRNTHKTFFTLCFCMADGIVCENYRNGKTTCSSPDGLFATLLIVFAVRGSFEKPGLFFSKSHFDETKSEN